MSIIKRRLSEKNKVEILDEIQGQACVGISETVYPVHNAHDLPSSAWNTESYRDSGGPCDNCILINPETQGQPISLFERFSIEYRQYDLRGSEISPEPRDTLSLYWERAQGLIECVGSQLLPQENNERFIYTMEANQQAINPSGLHPELVHDTEQANIGGLADVGIVRANHSVALSEKF
ncbi:unnamed protein product [Aspergillus oryzae]|nr:unnamed protein product [Aspergillus oryzae]GMF96329.1 unnamed protein product [Aspergillus oryzae]